MVVCNIEVYFTTCPEIVDSKFMMLSLQFRQKLNSLLYERNASIITDIASL